MKASETLANGGVTVGLDLGGTAVKGVACDAATGRRLTEASVTTERGFLEACQAVLADLEKTMGRRADAVGVSAPGLVDRSGERIVSMPGRLEGLVGLDWAAALGRERVPVMNDGHAALRGEVWQGAALGVRDVFLLTLGTGVGGAAMVDGRLLRGHLGRAGHLGHVSLDLDGLPDICGTRGALEDFVGNHNIATRSSGRFATTFDLVAAMQAGDVEARTVWERSIDALGAGIVSLINVLDPEVVLVGGGISKAWDQIEPQLSAYLDRHEWRPTDSGVSLRRATLGEWAGAYGAASAAASVVAVE